MNSLLNDIKKAIIKAIGVLDISSDVQDVVKNNYVDGGLFGWFCGVPFTLPEIRNAMESIVQELTRSIAGNIPKNVFNPKHLNLGYSKKNPDCPIIYWKYKRRKV